jgi:gas vesicle protein
MFFKGIYDKTSTYFSNLVNKIYSEISHLLVKMDNRIMKVQKEEQEEIERQRQVQKRREIQDQREKEKN